MKTTFGVFATFEEARNHCDALHAIVPSLYAKPFACSDDATTSYTVCFTGTARHTEIGLAVLRARIAMKSGLMP